MASHAEAAVNRSVKALMRRDDDLARRTKDDDSVIDRFEMEIDETALQLLAAQPSSEDLRLITLAMKISHDLERVGDEATTISRRCLELGREAPLRHSVEIPRLAGLALELLKDALDAKDERLGEILDQLEARSERVCQLEATLKMIAEADENGA